MVQDVVLEEKDSVVDMVQDVVREEKDSVVDMVTVLGQEVEVHHTKYHNLEVDPLMLSVGVKDNHLANNIIF